MINYIQLIYENTEYWWDVNRFTFRLDHNYEIYKRGTFNIILTGEENV